MDDIKDFFKESHEAFMIYVVEQRFIVGRGNEFFKSFKGKENLILSNESIKKRISKILFWVQKKIPNVTELVKGCCEVNPVIGIAEVVTALSKLFSINKHQAVGPEVLDPILIQEERIDEKYLTQLIALHEVSVLQPTIIILLKDNDFERAQKLLSHCPHGMNVKMIRNSGKSEIFKVINQGATAIEEFIDAYSRQCFSTCSHTPRNLLLNESWEHRSLVTKYSPAIFKVRSGLLFDEKKEVADDINFIIDTLEAEMPKNTVDKKLVLNFQCMSKLFRVYCHDYGGDDIQQAFNIAKELDNEILLAHVYRYSHFLNQFNLREKEQLLLKAKAIFTANSIEDHAIYCQNNYLVRDFYSDSINKMAFRDLQSEAVANVPGLVGMSIIYNNTGVAHLYTGEPEEAIIYFRKGLDYSKDRIVQKIGLMCNTLIAKDYCYQLVDEGELRKTLDYVFDNFGLMRLPFIAANYALNIIAIAIKQHPKIIKRLMSEYKIEALVKNALTTNQLGSGSLSLQIAILSTKCKYFDMPINIPKEVSLISGKRKSFLESHGYNPTIFNAWL